MQKQHKKSVESSMSIADSANTPAGDLASARLPKIRTVRDAKIFLGKIIGLFVRGKATDTQARTLSYLCQTFVSICEAADFESRIDAIEAKRKPENNTEPDYIEETAE